MVGFGAPIVLALGLFVFGIASIIPFGAGLLGFSRRVPVLLTAILTCGLIYLGVTTSSNAFKYQDDPYWFLLVKAGVTALWAIELLLVFLLAHWLGGRCRSGFLWVKNHKRS